MFMDRGDAIEHVGKWEVGLSTLGAVQAVPACVGRGSC